MITSREPKAWAIANDPHFDYTNQVWINLRCDASAVVNKLCRRYGVDYLSLLDEQVWDESFALDPATFVDIAFILGGAETGPKVSSLDTVSDLNKAFLRAAALELEYNGAISAVTTELHECRMAVLTAHTPKAAARYSNRVAKLSALKEQLFRARAIACY